MASNQDSPQLPKENISWKFVERPKGEYVPSKQFKSETEAAPKASDVKDGQILVEILYASIDPAMRPRMNGESFRILLPFFPLIVTILWRDARIGTCPND